MTMRIANLMSALLLVTAGTTVFTGKAMAEPITYTTDIIRLETIPDSFERALSNESGEYYYNRSIQRQAQFILGPSTLGKATFPDLELERDSKLINIIYRDTLYQQVSSDPVIRTLDLPNPYATSIRMMPSSRLNNRVMGSELIFERLPLR